MAFGERRHLHAIHPLGEQLHISGDVLIKMVSFLIDLDISSTSFLQGVLLELFVNLTRIVKQL